MNSDFFTDYLHERYRGEDFATVSMDQIAMTYEAIQNQRGVHFFKTPKGFVSYSLRGDAMIIHDIYVKKEYRGTKEARRMFNALEQFAQSMSKRVLIGFSDLIGKNQHLGITAMKAGGFVPAYETKTKHIYIKGI